MTTETKMPAPKCKTWKVVGTFDNYPKANELRDKLSGRGEEARVKFRPDGTFDVKVVK